MIETAVLGFPRIGPHRELKQALERHWAGRTPAEDLDQVAASIRREHIIGAARAGVDVIPCNDFSLYDHVLDTAVMVGAVPDRFVTVPFAAHERYFAMARGTATVRPLEMTKWFDTNYHYLVPEIDASTRFALQADKLLSELRDAREWGVRARPVVLGPLSFLLLAKSHNAALPLSTLLERLLPVYEELLAAISDAGGSEVQIDEPCLATDVTDEELLALERVWQRLVTARPTLQLTLATYFGSLRKNLDRILSLPAAEFHLDLVRAPEQLDRAVTALSPRPASLSEWSTDGTSGLRTWSR